LAAARGLRVVIETQPPLVRLLRSLPRIETVVGRGDPLPAFDLHCPMLSLPLAFGTTVPSIPAAPGYLHAAASEIDAWRTRFAAMRRPRVGLAWAGSAKLATDSRRSLDPRHLAPLFGVPGVSFFSLQKDRPALFMMTDVMDGVTDFAGTAGLVGMLDLVISVDTAVAHLAGALGKPVWLLDRFDPDWRWLAGVRKSPWYPGMRIYRQSQPGDWEAVLAEVAADLVIFREKSVKATPDNDCSGA
jgi:hypothetical protein